MYGLYLILVLVFVFCVLLLPMSQRSSIMFAILTSIHFLTIWTSFIHQVEMRVAACVARIDAGLQHHLTFHGTYLPIVCGKYCEEEEWNFILKFIFIIYFSRLFHNWIRAYTCYFKLKWGIIQTNLNHFLDSFSCYKYVQIDKVFCVTQFYWLLINFRVSFLIYFIILKFKSCTYAFYLEIIGLSCGTRNNSPIYVSKFDKLEH